MFLVIIFLEFYHHFKYIKFDLLENNYEKKYME